MRGSKRQRKKKLYGTRRSRKAIARLTWTVAIDGAPVFNLIGVDWGRGESTVCCQALVIEDGRVTAIVQGGTMRQP